MLNIFLDTNIYLNFYRFSNEDLKKLESLIALIDKTSDIKLYITEQVKNEFYRNRESVVNEIINKIDNIWSWGLNLPSFSKKYAEHSNLLASYRKLQTDKKVLKQNILDDVNNFRLAPDIIIEELFNLATNISNSDDILSWAEKRVFLWNPPGKKGSNWDAINWESLLYWFPSNQNLYFVWGDWDFKSPIDDKKFNLFLVDEWSNKKESEIYFYENISTFLKENFPGIEELGDYVKNKKIEDLKISHNFNHSRQILKDLHAMWWFNDSQLQKIFEYSYNNDQVWWAHFYSPWAIWSILSEFIKDKHELIPPELYDDFCRKFWIKKEKFYFQYEDGSWDEVPF